MSLINKCLISLLQLQYKGSYFIYNYPKSKVVLFNSEDEFQFNFRAIKTYIVKIVASSQLNENIGDELIEFKWN